MFTLKKHEISITKIAVASYIAKLKEILSDRQSNGQSHFVETASIKSKLKNAIALHERMPVLLTPEQEAENARLVKELVHVSKTSLGVTLAARQVLMQLVILSENFEVIISLQQLMNILGVSYSRLHNLLRELEKKGYIKQHRPYRALIDHEYPIVIKADNVLNCGQ